MILRGIKRNTTDFVRLKRFLLVIKFREFAEDRIKLKINKTNKTIKKVWIAAIDVHLCVQVKL